MQVAFRDVARLAMERAVRYREKSDGAPPPKPTLGPDALRRAFDVPLPEKGLGGLETIKALADAAEPGNIGNTSPNFFGWVMGASDPVGVAADWLTSAWGQNSGIYHTAPSSAMAEDVVAGWLLELLDLPRDCSVGFTTGATMAGFTCLAAARSEVLHRHGWNLEEEGLNGAPPLQIFLGREAHTTIYNALRYLGFGTKNVTHIEVDEEGRMLADDLGVRMDSHDGPKIVICQAGHINSGAFDPVTDICAHVRRHNSWLHVDGAFGLWARATGPLRPLAEGLDLADSWSVDGHKWLQVPYDAGYAIVKDRDAHARAMTTAASYLEEAPGDGRSPSSYAPELSRRARGFAAWAVIQSLGREGIAEMVLRHCRAAQHLAARLAQVPGIEVVNEVALNQVAVGFCPGEPAEVQSRMADAVIDAVQAENTSYVGGALWKGRRILRVSVISRTSDIADVDRLYASITRAWQEISPDGVVS